MKIPEQGDLVKLRTPDGFLVTYDVLETYGKSKLVVLQQREVERVVQQQDDRKDRGVQTDLY